MNYKSIILKANKKKFINKNMNNKFLIYFICLFIFATLSLLSLLMFDNNGFSLPFLLNINVWLMVTIPLSGFCLGVSSYLIQHSSGNKIADTSILGVGNVNALLLVLMILGLDFNSDDSINNYKTLLPYAFVFGSIGASLLIYFLSAKRNKQISKRFVITGILINFFFTAIAGTLSIYLTPGKSVIVNSFISGKIDQFINEDFLFCSIITLILCIWLLLIINKFKIVSTNAEIAKELGINANFITFQIIIISGALTGIAYILVGNITFLGLVAGNIATTLFKKKMIYGIFGSWFSSIIIMSVTFLIFVNIIPGIYDFQIPTINPSYVISLISIPYFIYLLFRT